MISNYLSGRYQQVEIGGKRSEKRVSNIGVLQGSSLSPLFFLIYFLGASGSVRTCNKCQEEVNLSPKERTQHCPKCGSGVIYADDMNTITTSSGFNKSEIETKVTEQGLKIDNLLKLLSLSMNKKKSQFTAIMNYQRRRPSRATTEEREMRGSKMEVIIGGVKLTEADGVKTLGVTFDSEIKFSTYWNDLKVQINRRIYALNQIRSHLSFKQRNELYRSLVLSKIEYCLEATASCNKVTLAIPCKLLNRAVRSAAGI